MSASLATNLFVSITWSFRSSITQQEAQILLGSEHQGQVDGYTFRYSKVDLKRVDNSIVFNSAETECT